MKSGVCNLGRGWSVGDILPSPAYIQYNRLTTVCMFVRNYSRYDVRNDWLATLLLCVLYKLRKRILNAKIKRLISSTW